MGGGRGTRLYPLTKLRSKPAVPIGGKYRLIDIPISNCINSSIYRIAVLTQFNSVSLNRHISQTYVFDSFHPGWVNIWAAEQTMERSDWYQGTADAVRKQLFQIRSTRADYVLILAGDHLYRMAYDDMAQFHWDHKADITVAVQPVRPAEASRLGILKRDKDGRIVRFAEKPKEAYQLTDLVSNENSDRPYLGSMGIYMFKAEVLIDLLEDTPFEDFGNHVIPHALADYDVYGYNFDGFWVDIGTIRSFYEINLMLTEPDPKFNLFDPSHPVYSHPGFLPGTILDSCSIEQVLLSEGCCIKRSEIRHSVVGLRSQIRSGAVILDSIVMGADFYDDPCGQDDNDMGDIPGLGVGRDCHIEGAIIDKNARIGRGVVIKPFPRGTEKEGGDYWIQDGIVVVPKNSTILPGTIIAPES
jgi:glucose-1-phosphate adenylyltransferase